LDGTQRRVYNTYWKSREVEENKRRKEKKMNFYIVV
jgi:hypothetical protein